MLTTTTLAAIHTGISSQESPRSCPPDVAQIRVSTYTSRPAIPEIPDNTATVVATFRSDVVAVPSSMSSLNLIMV
jgi:hypothetical protein